MCKRRIVVIGEEFSVHSMLSSNENMRKRAEV